MSYWGVVDVEELLVEFMFVIMGNNQIKTGRYLF